MSEQIQVGARRIWPSGKEIEVIERVAKGEYAGEFRYRYLAEPSEGILSAEFLLSSTTPAPSGAPSLVELDLREAEQERTKEWERVMGAALEWEYADAYPGTPAAKDATEALDDLRTAVRAYRESEAARRAVTS